MNFNFLGWFPDQIVFTYQHLLFLFYVSPQPTGTGTDFLVVTVLMILFFVVPYILMVMFCFWNGCKQGVFKVWSWWRQRHFERPQL